MEIVVVSCLLLTLAESVYIPEVTTNRHPTTDVLAVSENFFSPFIEKLNQLSSSHEVSTQPFYPTTPLCCSTEPNNFKIEELIVMSTGIEAIPEGDPDIRLLDAGYNKISALPNYIFYNNSYLNLKKIILQQNKISNISVHAFKEIRHVREIDLSDNLLTTLDPYTFKWNVELKKLILMNNLITLTRRQTLILSYSLEHLVLSNNKIDQIYELNFLGVPNLNSLFLNDNEIDKIAPNSFRMLSKLRYLSLANTGVYRLGISMFSQIPRILNLDGTPLAAKFEPPLTMVIGESVLRLLDLSSAMESDESNSTSTTAV